MSLLAGILSVASAAGVPGAGLAQSADNLFGGSTNATDQARDQRAQTVLTAAQKGSVLAARFILGGMSGDASIKAPASADQTRFRKAYNALLNTSGGSQLLAVAQGATDTPAGCLLNTQTGALWNPHDDPHTVPYSGPIGDAVNADVARVNPSGGYAASAPATSGPYAQPAPQTQTGVGSTTMLGAMRSIATVPSGSISLTTKLAIGAAVVAAMIFVIHYSRSHS